MYNLIEYSNNYLKASEFVWQYYTNMPGEADNSAIRDSELQKMLK